MSKLRVYVGASNQALPSQVDEIIRQVEARGHEVVRWKKGTSYSNQPMLESDLVLFVPPYGSMHRLTRTVVVGVGQANQLDALYRADKEDDVYFVTASSFGELHFKKTCGSWYQVNNPQPSAHTKVELNTVQSIDSVFVPYERLGSSYLGKKMEDKTQETNWVEAFDVIARPQATLQATAGKVAAISRITEEPSIAGAVILGLI